MTTTKISRTARFYKLVAVGTDGTPASLPALDFAAALNKYRQRALPLRRHTLGDAVYLFDPRDTSNRHLAIHKLRSPSDFMARVSTSGEVTEIMAVDETGSFADSSAVSFLPYGNIFGIVGGSQSSPRAGRVADWLNEVKPFDPPSLTFSVVPVLAQPALDALKDAVGARRVSVNIRGSDLGAADDNSSQLGAGMRSLLGELDDAKLTLTITSGHQHPTPSLRAKLLDFARDLASNVGTDARAQAAVVHEVPAKQKNKTKLTTEIVDLVEYHIAQEFEIPVSAEGVKIDLTLAQIDVIAGSERASLRRSLGEEGDDGAQTPEVG